MGLARRYVCGALVGRVVCLANIPEFFYTWFMFNRARFCFLNKTPWSDPDSFKAPKKRTNPDLSSGEILEAELCSDGVWRVLELETKLKIARIIYL